MYTYSFVSAALLASTASAHAVSKVQRDAASSTASSSAAASTAPGSTGATTNTTKDSGPNGAESWFNTGLDGDGWTPPYLNFTNVIHIDTDTFYNGVGSACKQYDQYFQASGPKYNIDPAILAAIAMQESSCNAYPDDGSNGTPGLMQVACSNYPDMSCDNKSVGDNVDAGAHYLRTNLDSSNNNVIAAVGAYNGWFQAGDGSPDNGKGLTEGYPCSSAGQANGQPQNLDYLQETLNGWFQGKDVYGADSYIGSYQCSGSCDNGAKC